MRDTVVKSKNLLKIGKERMEDRDLDAELCALQAIVLDPTLLKTSTLSIEDFTNSDYKKIYTGLLRLDADGIEIELKTLQDYCLDVSALTLSELLGSAVTAANFGYHVKILKEKLLQRQCKRSLLKLQNLVEEGTEGLEQAMVEALEIVKSGNKPPSQFHDTYSTRETVKLKVSTLQDILDYEDPTYLIEPILIEKTLVILSAYAGTYKSLLSLFIAFSIITGRKLFDFFNVSKCGKVLIIDEENPGSFLKERLLKIGFTNDMPISFLHFQKVKLDRLDCFKELIQIIKDLKPTLIIFDSLIRFHNAKENETSEMAFIMEKLRDFVNLGTTVLVIHHHRKGAGDRKELLRGSSDILGGVDMHLSIEEKGDCLILSSPKTRAKPFDPIRLKFDSIEDSLTFRYVGKEFNENQIILNEITDMLKDDLKLGVKEILEEIKSRDYEIGQNRLREILQGATGKELTETTGDRGRKLYSLNSSFTVSRGIYRGVNCEGENEPDNDLHSFTEAPPLNCETGKQEVTDQPPKTTSKKQVVNSKTLTNNGLDHLTTETTFPSGKKKNIKDLEKMEVRVNDL